MKISQLLAIPLLAAIAVPFAAQAETRKAFCQYFPNGASEPKVSMGCKFSMNQGNIEVRWDDGVSDYFRTLRGRPFTYTDDRGSIVYQQRGEEQADGTSARIMKMENGSIYIWGS